MSNDFARLGVPSNLVDALAAHGITTPTPIQAATLPDSLAGRDVLGRGRTGSGKSFAFLAPLVARLSDGRRAQPKRPRGLVLAPTRELAMQLMESLKPLQEAAGLRSQVVFGGVNQNPQVKALAAGVDIVIACPGRLLDLMGQRALDLSAIEITVIDEADHMADMGFLPMVRRILDATPRGGQRMLFSATLDEGIGVIAKKYLTSPVVHEADSAEPVSEMKHHVLRVANDHRVAVVADLAAAPGRTIVFTRTKHGAKKLAKQLVGRGVPAIELHGNLSQNARTRNMDAFHSGKVQTLVATDIAARGIHVDDVELVVHADPPTEHKAYLHRSGRTARAGNSGTVVTIAGESQLREVHSLMRAARIKDPLIADGAPGDAALAILAPGERIYLDPEAAQAMVAPNQPQSQAAPARTGGQRRRSSGRSAGGRDQSRSASGGRDQSRGSSVREPSRAAAGRRRARRPQQSPKAS